MFNAQNNFGSVTRLQAQAIGQPGERTFRLLIESEDGRSAALWLEKEQLQALGLAVEQLRQELQGRLASSSQPSEMPAVESFSGTPSLEFKIGRLALGQDESELESGPRYVVLAYDIETGGADDAEEPSQPPTFACRATREQIRALSRNVAEVVAGGRPRCPLCGQPVQAPDQPHGCVRSNGHHKS